MKLAEVMRDGRLRRYDEYLAGKERSQGTRDKYLRDVRAFTLWLDGRAVSRETVREWKSFLLTQHYAPVTINSMLIALNGFLHFCGLDDCRVQLLKVQRRLFREAARELTRTEYERLLLAARGRGKERLTVLMETICATGIRVSEVKFITVEAARKGRTDISLKGKIRTILLPNKLCRKLLKYAKNKKIASGEIFLTGSGQSLSRRQIWAEMKRLCKTAGVEATKVFPHNLRHLFATTFYNTYKDIAKLADVLGHSSVETTRIYLVTTGTEHARQLEQLHLIL